ncbi:DUF3291 domain-containing protein [Frankia sp. Ag45/Mut15]|uniref:DUF3291 domain-containing protein n=1 Tax=Frankia umida TaxID=573489 RepID=A0ABT0JXS8_9ACTN|nr:DUF3291 domain-containing protein [Frankia umida]MCK9876353.1 DUF3291 domain-containing protein [Frankia umida]
MTGFHLAQVNIARVREPLAPLSAGALAAGLSAPAEPVTGQPGYLWSLGAGTETGAAQAAPHTFRLGSAEQLAAIVNLAVWESVDALCAAVLRNGEGAFLRRRRDWFHPTHRSTNALWWVPAGHRPDPAEAEDRVRHLRAHGPTPTAFTLRLTFPPPTASQTGSAAAGQAG